jgi:hypothetical protein
MAGKTIGELVREAETAPGYTEAKRAYDKAHNSGLGTWQQTTLSEKTIGELVRDAETAPGYAEAKRAYELAHNSGVVRKVATVEIPETAALDVKPEAVPDVRSLTVGPAAVKAQAILGPVPVPAV